MSKMRIYAAQYRRTGDSLTAIRVDDHWVLRDTFGPSWFYNVLTWKFDISTGGGVDFRGPQYALTVSQAMGLMKTLGLNPCQGGKVA